MVEWKLHGEPSRDPFVHRWIKTGRENESKVLWRHNTVLQAEVTAITECIKQVNIMGLAGDITIFTDSQAAIRALSKDSVASMTILRCKEKINNFSSRGRIKIIWVPGHCGIVANEMANNLARGGSFLELVTLENAKPFQDLRAELIRLG